MQLGVLRRVAFILIAAATAYLLASRLVCTDSVKQNRLRNFETSLRHI